MAEERYKKLWHTHIMPMNTHTHLHTNRHTRALTHTLLDGKRWRLMTGQYLFLRSSRGILKWKQRRASSALGLASAAISLRHFQRDQRPLALPGQILKCHLYSPALLPWPFFTPSPSCYSTQPPPHPPLSLILHASSLPTRKPSPNVRLTDFYSRMLQSPLSSWCTWHQPPVLAFGGFQHRGRRRRKQFWITISRIYKKISL